MGKINRFSSDTRCSYAINISQRDVSFIYCYLVTAVSHIFNGIVSKVIDMGPNDLLVTQNDNLNELCANIHTNT